MDMSISGAREIVRAVLDLANVTLDASSTKAVVFGVNVGGHFFVEAILLVAIVFLLLQKSYKPPKRPLTEKEIDDLCDEWKPEPLINPLTEKVQYKVSVLESAAGPHTLVNGKDVVNLASTSYLGLIGDPRLLSSCISILEKYGVGSCGPRSFYGTIDIHLDCEARIARFLGTRDSILYSYGMSAVFSAIPAFCKKGDVIVADEGVHWAIQNGLTLSRSTVVFFKHNDMESLESCLHKITSNKRSKKIRRYIIIEAVYQNSGRVAPLGEILRLKEKYLFRILLDESNSLGVLGKTGRGLTEHCGIPIEKIDIITAAMGHALATEGGFCTGSVQVVDHQRLSSSGYVFSASLPPYLASAAITALDILEQNPDLVLKLKHNVHFLWDELMGVDGGLCLESDRDSPVVLLRLKKPSRSVTADLNLLQAVADRLLEEFDMLVSVSRRSPLDSCRLPVGIRLFISAAHSETDLINLSKALKTATTSSFLSI